MLPMLPAQDLDAGPDLADLPHGGAEGTSMGYVDA